MKLYLAIDTPFHKMFKRENKNLILISLKICVSSDISDNRMMFLPHFSCVSI